MKTLIVEDDFTSRLLLQELLRSHGPTHVAVNGLEAVDAVNDALDEDEPYDLICLDIMMPEMDGQQALHRIRALEKSRGILEGWGAKVLMTTALSDKDNVMGAFREMADGYLVKPIAKDKLLGYLKRLELVAPGAGV